MRTLLPSAAALALGSLEDFTGPLPALADHRVALIIANSAYQNAPTLPNPSKDAQAIAAKFREAGFDTVERYNLGIVDFKREIRLFLLNNARESDFAVVFYAGHAMEIHGWPWR
jgi:uncharacterized caspase-like protein